MTTIAPKPGSGRLAPLKHKAQSLLRSIGLELVHDFDADAFRLRRFRDLGANQWRAARTILGREPHIILDVGANTGQTALELAHRFPTAKIHSFEPAPASVSELKRRVSHLPNITAHKLALGDFNGSAPFHVNRMSQTNSLLPTAAGQPSRKMETVDIINVEVRTVASLGIGPIDILKTDAQGADLKVIEGASGLRIPLVYTEVCFVSLYEGQPPFGVFHDRMQELGYRLVDLYETSFHARFYQLSCNALFMRHDGPRPRG